MHYRPLRNNSVLAALFVAALIFAFAGRITPIMGAYLALAIVVVAANVRVFGTASQPERNAAIVLVVALTIMLPISVIRSETAVLHYVVVLLSLGAGFVLTRNIEVYLVASRLTLVASQITVFAYLAKRGVANFPLQDMIPDSSANGVTSYMVLLQANYCIVNHVVTKKSSLVTAILTLAICIVGFGRGSILSAAAIVALGMASMVWLGGRRRALLVVAVLLLSSMGITIWFGEEISNFITANTKIGSGLFDVHRVGMLTEYLEKMDPLSVWTGGSYAGTSIVSEYNSNPHNSFIRAHYIFGLPYLALMFLLPVYLTHSAHRPSVKIYAAGMWLIVLFRAFTEPVLFPTLFDFFFFASCFVLSRDPATSLRPVARPC